MPRDFEVYLQDILEAIGKLNAYTAGMSRLELENDSKTVDAVLRNLEVIGEAVKAIPGQVRDAHPEIEWRKIAGLRDILITTSASIWISSGTFCKINLMSWKKKCGTC